MLVKHTLIDVRAGSKVFDTCVSSVHCFSCGFQGFSCLCIAFSFFLVQVPRFLTMVKHTFTDIRAGSRVSDDGALCFHCFWCGFQGL